MNFTSGSTYIKTTLKNDNNNEKNNTFVGPYEIIELLDRNRVLMAPKGRTKKK